LLMGRAGDEVYGVIEAMTPSLAAMVMMFCEDTVETIYSTVAMVMILSTVATVTIPSQVAQEAIAFWNMAMSTSL
ncbi:MAG: hypothetical protein AAFY63_16790, partial [Cyanobacteria bacterium J06643_13]